VSQRAIETATIDFMRRFIPVLPLLLCALSAQTRSLTENDLYEFKWIAAPQMSPDASRIAFARVEVNAKRKEYETSLWIVPTTGGSPRRLTFGKRDSNPTWSPDGKTLAFIRAVERDGKTQPPQIFLLSMEGGEPRQLTELAKGSSDPVWSPDGKWIAFRSTTLEKDMEAKPEEVSDVRVITRATYRSNGAGYPDVTRPMHIWIASVDGSTKPRPLTHGAFAESEPTWARDGSKLYFVSNRVKEPYYEAPDADLWEVALTGGEPKRVASIDGPISSISLSADGSRMAFIANISKPTKSHSQRDLFVANLQTGSVRNLTEKLDEDIGGAVGGDQAAPRGASREAPFWSKDGRYIYATRGKEGRENFVRIDSDNGKMDVLVPGDHAVQTWTCDESGTKVALLVSTPTRIHDLFLTDTTGAALKQVTNINNELFSTVKITEPEMIWYNSFDGKRIQAWVQRPPDYDPSKKYPLILNIHGGPHTAYGYVFDHEFQWMAAKGYIVLYPNPRGSTTYGQEFGNVIQHAFPGDDAKDLLAGVDYVVKQGWVDPEKLGVTGGSGGGILTNWIITQTNRFKAAVAQRSIADWETFWYTADFTLFQPSWFKGAPWEDRDGFASRSPIRFVDRIKTPLMLIEGEADLRTPPAAGGEMMFRALKYRRIPTVMVRFPGESHELSRSGVPDHRVERLRHIVGWFDKYLMGASKPEYEVQ
jgi:dipeptidyl aminopeptidase/acylaminoacyl peptidase